MVLPAAHPNIALPRLCHTSYRLSVLSDAGAQPIGGTQIHHVGRVRISRGFTRGAKTE